ncbi:MAG: flippase-like domain-containing protein [Deltaproteobacteria bacterium]|nr:flippase-like domain-containing protein [Deltaproteobacteria bacterium]
MSLQQTEKKSFSRKVLRFLPKTAGIFILIYLFYRTGWRAPVRMVREIGVIPFLFLLSLNIPHIFLKAFRWKLMVNKSGGKITNLESLRIYFAGIAMGIFTPGRAGEMFRAVYVVDEKFPLQSALGTVIADRLFDLGFLLTVSAVSTFFLIGFSWLIVLIILAVGAVSGTAILILIHGKLLERIESRFFKNSAPNLKFTDALKISFSNFPLKIILTGLAYGIMNFQVYIIAIQGGMEISYIQSFLLFSLANTFALLPLSISGLGTREAALGWLFSISGFSAAQGVSVSFSFFMLVVIPVTLVGIAALFFSPSLRKVDSAHADNP